VDTNLGGVDLLIVNDYGGRHQPVFAIDIEEVRKDAAASSVTSRGI